MKPRKPSYAATNFKVLLVIEDDQQVTNFSMVCSTLIESITLKFPNVLILPMFL